MRRHLAWTLAFMLVLLPELTPAQGPVTVIVFPLENLSRLASLGWVGDGVALALSEELSSPGVRVIDRSARVQLVENADLPPNATLSRASMIRVGQLAGADLIVMGNCSGTAEKFQIALSVFDLRTLRMGGEISANGPLAALPEMENELAWNILSNAGLNPGRSRDQFKERTRTIPNSAYSYYMRALEASREEDQNVLLEKAVTVDRDFPDAQFLLGRNYFEAGKCPKAIEHLELGRKSNQPYVSGDFMLGNCFLESNALSDAIRCYSSLLAFARPLEALNNEGVAYLRKGDEALAIQSLLEAHNLDPDSSIVAFNLALVRHLQGNDSAARSDLERPTKSHPGNGMLQFVLGIVLKSLGDEERAAGALAKAKSLRVEVEQLQKESPKSWALTFTTLERRGEDFR